MPGLLFI